MTPRRPDLFEGAPCRTVEHLAWMRKHRGSKWDYKVGDETDRQADTRRNWAKGQCLACPETAQNHCRALHDALSRATSIRVSGIWGGVIHPDQEPKPEIPGQRALPYDDDMAA